MTRRFGASLTWQERLLDAGRATLAAGQRAAAATLAAGDARASLTGAGR